ncbi:hypothetical protein ColLi_10581 [Colletotrichum liriopes]|uniref:Uncharacterized protein n=1 Tax=Colletotrichum liriopes TaxID=708192 RepID=A0AA37GX86_9PEZI|nr:hypothetical protein ColLi_10581 [Colletotrichum liriopes]
MEKHKRHKDGHASVPHRRPRDGQHDMLEDDASEEHGVEGRTDAEDGSARHSYRWDFADNVKRQWKWTIYEKGEATTMPF